MSASAACRFCGSSNSRATQGVPWGARLFWRECCDCGAQGPAAGSAQDADEAWNGGADARRDPPATPDAVAGAGELLPCPFCDEWAESDANRAVHYNEGNGSSIAVYCAKCPAAIEVCREDVPSVTLEMVKGLWNRRTTPAQSPRVAELEGALRDLCSRCYRYQLDVDELAPEPLRAALHAAEAALTPAAHTKREGVEGARVE